MGDFEASLKPKASPSFRDKCLNSISNAASQWKLACLVLAWLAFALMGYVLILVVLFQYIQLGGTNQNSRAVISSINVATSADEIVGIWDMNLYLNNNIQDFEYKANARVYSDGEFVLKHKLKEHKLKGQGSLVRGNFWGDLAEDFSRDKGVTLGLSVEAEVKVPSKFRWVKKKTTLKIDCHDLKIEFPLNTTVEPGTLSNGPTTCKVQTSPWKLTN